MIKPKTQAARLTNCFMRNCFRYLLRHFPGRPPRTPNAAFPRLKFPQRFPLPHDFTARRPAEQAGEQGISPRTLLAPRHLLPSAFPRLSPAAAGAHNPATGRVSERGFPGTGSQAAGLKQSREAGPTRESPAQPRPGQARQGPLHHAPLAPPRRTGEGTSPQARALSDPAPPQGEPPCPAPHRVPFRQGAGRRWVRSRTSAPPPRAFQRALALR